MGYGHEVCLQSGHSNGQGFVQQCYTAKSNYLHLYYEKTIILQNHFSHSNFPFIRLPVVLKVSSKPISN